MNQNQVVVKKLDSVRAMYNFIRNNQGKFASVTFRKRSTNEIRTINGRLGVRQGVTGAGKKFDDGDKGLVTISEVKPVRDNLGRFTKGGKMQFRSFGVEAVIRIRFKHQDITIPMNY